jgi:hypothetical protein
MTEQRLTVRNSQNINAIRCLDTRELSPKCQKMENGGWSNLPLSSGGD